jgi:hypothetical protein
LWNTPDLQWLSDDDNLVTMAERGRDPGIEVLLDLDGQLFVVDTKADTGFGSL